MEARRRASIPSLLGSILDALPRTSDAEVTVECNPEDASRDRFSSWLSAGVKRVSFGAQSMVPEVLKGSEGAISPGSSSRRCRSRTRAGFSSVSVDLIFGGAGETDERLGESLETVLSFDPPPQHLSCYALTVEPGTPLASDPARHPDDDAQAGRYEMAELGPRIAAGYDWYEVSNWSRARPRVQAQPLYWQQGDYRGIGCAAHSHRQAADGSGTSGPPSGT